MVFANFRKIGVFRKYQEKDQIWLHFRRPRWKKSIKNGIQKCIFLLTLIFERFFPDFRDLGSILGGLGPLKNCKNLWKNGLGVRLEGVWDAGAILGAIFKISEALELDF